MSIRKWGAVPAFLVFAGALVATLPAAAQTTEVKEKPPMYTFVSSFAFPRGKWADVEKQHAVTGKVLEKAGKLVAYGYDTTLVHTNEGMTHDTFWSAMSLGPVLGVLDDLLKEGATTSPTLAGATKHDDDLVVSRYYNWKPGAFKGGYTHEGVYQLKDTAPDNAVDIISKSFGVPLFEKLLADGAILEYEIDEEYIHTDSPSRFWVVYITPNAEGLDKVNAALNGAFGASPFIGPALDSMVDSNKHRDYLARTDGVYK